MFWITGIIHPGDLVSSELVLRGEAVAGGVPIGAGKWRRPLVSVATTGVWPVIKSAFPCIHTGLGHSGYVGPRHVGVAGVSEVCSERCFQGSAWPWHTTCTQQHGETCRVRASDLQEPSLVHQN